MAIGRHVRVNIKGEWTGAPWAGEIWQTGFSLVTGSFVPGFQPYIKRPLSQFNVDPVAYNQDETTWNIDWAWQGTDQFTQIYQLGIANKCRTFFDALKSYVPSASRMTGVNISAFDSDGKVIFGGNEFMLKTPLAGTATATNWRPPQDCVVLSLQTGARGPGGRGRMYLPLNAISLQNGLIGSSVTTAVLNAGQALLEDTQDELVAPSVVNKGPLTFSTVVTIAVGDQVDTQQRRRREIPENYTTRNLNV